jgi:hypothetical protein
MSRSLIAAAFLSFGLGWAGVCRLPQNYLSAGHVPPSLRSNFTCRPITPTAANAKTPISRIFLDGCLPCAALAGECKTHSIPVLFSRV